MEGICGSLPGTQVLCNEWRLLLPPPSSLPSGDGTWACSSHRAPELLVGGRLQSVLTPSPARTVVWVRTVGVSVSTRSLSCLKGPHPFSLPALPSSTSRGWATPRGLSVLACPLRLCVPPSSFCPAFPPHTHTPGSLTILLPLACPTLAGIPSPGVSALSVCPARRTPFVVSVTGIVCLLASCRLFMLLRVQRGFPELLSLWVCSTCKPLAPSAWNNRPRPPRPSRSLLHGVRDPSHRRQDSCAFFWAMCLCLQRLWAHSSFFGWWPFMDLPCLFSLRVRVRNRGTYLLTTCPWVGDVSSVGLPVLTCQLRSRLPRSERLQLTSHA